MRGQGFAWRPSRGTQLLIGDDNARTNVFLRVTDVEDGLVRPRADVPGVRKGQNLTFVRPLLVGSIAPLAEVGA